MGGLVFCRPSLWDGWFLLDQTMDAPVKGDILAWDEGCRVGIRTFVLATLHVRLHPFVMEGLRCRRMWITC
jgi:hypothetical protein